MPPAGKTHHGCPRPGDFPKALGLIRGGGTSPESGRLIEARSRCSVAPAAHRRVPTDVAPGRTCVFDELLRSDVGDIRARRGQRNPVRGKGGTDRRIPLEQKLIEVLDTHLDSRAVRVARNAALPPADRLRGRLRSPVRGWRR